MRSKLDPDNLRDQLIDILEALLEAQLRAIRKMRQSRDRQMMATDERGTKRMSHVDIVHEILRTAGLCTSPRSSSSRPPAWL
jgi:hypothetical protein